MQFSQTQGGQSSKKLGRGTATGEASKLLGATKPSLTTTKVYTPDGLRVEAGIINSGEQFLELNSSEIQVHTPTKTNTNTKFRNNMGNDEHDKLELMVARWAISRPL